jgi:transposase
MSNRKTYSKEFKEESVRLAQQNWNVTETARNLGLQQSVLRRWKKEFNQDGEKADLRCSGWAGPFRARAIRRMDEELRQLQRENQRLEETIEILEPMLHS